MALAKLWNDQRQRGLYKAEHQLAYDLAVERLVTTELYLRLFGWVLLVAIGLWGWTHLSPLWAAGLFVFAFITAISVPQVQSQQILETVRFPSEDAPPPATDPMPDDVVEEYITGSTRPIHSYRLKQLQTGRKLRRPYRSFSFVAVHYRWFAIVSLFAAVAITGRLDLPPLVRSMLFSDVIMMGTSISLALVLQHHLLAWWRGFRAWPFRTIILRRFGHRSDLVTQMVFGTLGVYGTASVLNRKKLAESQVEDFLRTYTESPVTIAQFLLPPHMLARIDVLIEDEKWQECVIDQLHQADCAVVDVTEISNSIEWEMHQLAAALPPERWILIARNGWFEAFDKWVASQPEGTLPPMRPGAPFRIAYRTNPLGRGLLRIKLIVAVLAMDQRDRLPA